MAALFAFARRVWHRVRRRCDMPMPALPPARVVSGSTGAACPSRIERVLSAPLVDVSYGVEYVVVYEFGRAEPVRAVAVRGPIRAPTAGPGVPQKR